MTRIVIVLAIGVRLFAAAASGSRSGRRRSASESLDARIDILEAKIERAREREGVLSAEIEAATQKIDALEGEVGAAEARLDQLETVLALQQQRLDRLNELFHLQTTQARQPAPPARDRDEAARTGGSSRSTPRSRPSRSASCSRRRASATCSTSSSS